jgi:hypothetical protein
MSIPVNGFIVALESWGRRADEPTHTWVLIRTPVGSYEQWHGRGLDGRIVTAAAQGAHTTLALPAGLLDRHQQTWTREDAAKAFTARAMKAAIGGQDGWHPCYQGPLVLQGLGVDRFGASSRFREHAPADPNAAPPQPKEVTFDPNDFQARLKARRAQQAAVKQVEADLAIEREGGIRRVKAFRDPTQAMLADLPVVGFSTVGPQHTEIRGHIHSCNPQFAVIEAKVEDLDQFPGGILWTFGYPYPFTVGVTAADHR